MKYTIDDAVHFLRKKQASFKKNACKYNSKDDRYIQMLKASERMGIIAEWLLDYKELKNADNSKQ